MKAIKLPVVCAFRRQGKNNPHKKALSFAIPCITTPKVLLSFATTFSKTFGVREVLMISLGKSTF